MKCCLECLEWRIFAFRDRLSSKSLPIIEVYNDLSDYLRGHFRLLKQITIGIDAANIRLGGGVTHLAEILTGVDVQALNIGKIVVWSGEKTAAQLPAHSWLQKISPPQLNGSLLSRVFWQALRLSNAAREHGCDVLLVPGGSYVGNFKPVVTMSQNLLPFEWTEISRNQSIFTIIKLMILRQVQSFSFRRSDGVIFLTQYAKNQVFSVIGNMRALTTVIYHGFNHRFDQPPKSQRPISDYAFDKPLNILYVSNIDVYKHQIEVVGAVYQLRNKGFPISLTLIGPAIPGYLHQLNQTLNQLDPQRLWAKYLGQIPYADLPAYYQKADIGLFASSCETFGIILLEKMSAGLPIACSNKSAMPEILKDAGVYFDPDNVLDIELTLECFISQAQLRQEKSLQSFNESKKYQWAKCAQETFSFVANIARKHL